MAEVGLVFIYFLRVLLSRSVQLNFTLRGFECSGLDSARCKLVLDHLVDVARCAREIVDHSSTCAIKHILNRV